MKIVFEPDSVPGGIPVTDMKFGEIGQITRWSYEKYSGIFVARNGEDLVAIFGDYRWGNVFVKNNQENFKNCFVKILPPGTKLEITGNLNFPNKIMKIIEEPKNDISIREMVDGQIGIITEFPGNPKHVNEIVQRYGVALIVLGQNLGNSWPTAFVSLPEARVRILPPGTKIEI